MQIFDVLGMQISQFEGKKQEEYLNPKLINFKIMTCVLIWLATESWKQKHGFFEIL